MLIDGVLGEGSIFHEQFGYYADGVAATTAKLPTDWHLRSKIYLPREAPGVKATCPEENDIALSKLCAWREKDQVWLRDGLISGVLRLEKMHDRLDRMPPGSPTKRELTRRLNSISLARVWKGFPATAALGET